MTFARLLSLVLLFSPNAIIGSATAQDLPDALERFAGETRIETQPPLPTHLELHRDGAAIKGTISMPIGAFEMTATQQQIGSITGSFEGPGGTGDMTLAVDGDMLTGTFSLGEARGTISAQRTVLDARTFFLPPPEMVDLTTAQWFEDLDRLTEILTQEHAAPFHRIAREEFEREVTRVRAAIPDLDGIGVALELRKLGALIGDGHTQVALPHNPRLPVEFFWFQDGLRVVGISVDHQAALGAKLVAVNAVPVDEVVARLRPFIPAGETEGFFRAGVPGLLSNPDVLAAIGVVDGSPVPLTFEAQDGGLAPVELTASSDAGEWATLNGGAPLWQQEGNQSFWSQTLADGSLYVNWRSYDHLADKVAALLRDLDAQRPPRLIIDLRDNTGGDYNAGRAFIEAIGSRPWLNRAGGLYVLIGRTTFSAAMTNAVDFKTMTNAILVGEPAGAAPNNWQEVRRFNLPNSGLLVGVSTLHYEFLPGEAEVRPDLHVWSEPGDWGASQDASVRLILAQP
ncbi:S41 family peptidase [Devosia sp.]|uniref:S41 family peptidase n=1 Tax=Devosia sp. TaxID=1871048 RepID=UPI001B2E9110|nr:S41 family peptidase [Devosia sp.]MBO9588529.1 hypothetical protein [Devosia sp.]